MVLVDLLAALNVRALLDLETRDPVQAVAAVERLIVAGQILPEVATPAETGFPPSEPEVQHIILPGEERGTATRNRAFNAYRARPLAMYEPVRTPLPPLPTTDAPMSVLVAGSVSWQATIPVQSVDPEEAYDEALQIAASPDGRGIWQLVRPDRTPGPGFMLGVMAVIDRAGGQAYELMEDRTLRTLVPGEDPRLLLHVDNQQAESFANYLSPESREKP